MRTSTRPRAPQRSAAAILAVATALAAGCAGPADRRAAEGVSPAPIAAAPGTAAVSAPVDAPSPPTGHAAAPTPASELPAARLYPPGPARAVFLDDEGERVVREASAPDARGVWTLAEADADGPRQILTLTTLDGGPALLRLDVPADDGRRRRFAFDPPLQLLPEFLTEDAEHAARTRFAEMDGRSGEAISAATAARDADGRWTVAVRIVLDLPPARVTRSSVTTLDAEGRVLGVESERLVRVFGIVAERDRTRLRAAD
jgi:hypothetical protein